MELTAPETRVLGCLLEKELATPNGYPLTLNSLLSATNQTSNRDPIVTYDEADVVEALSGLRQKGVARVVLGSGHRAEKYRHTLEDIWGLDEQHRAVLAVLMLRGPQTVGELRQRTERLARFDSLAEVEQVLRLLANREEPLARRLERAPGQKEARWVELFSGEAAALEAAARTESDIPDEGRPKTSTEVLREEVAALREEVAALRQQLEDLLH
ncbi:MAG TPA: YceH family protein [Acidimicrobiales bacterium]|nr:YceH family protein [Acidimicrobiales bacterium]